MKQITGVYTAPRPHWVGDGFPVRSLFSYQSHAQHVESISAAGLCRAALIYAR